MKKFKLVCKKCGGDNIHVKAWVNANTNIYVDECGEDAWCDTCEDTTILITKILEDEVEFYLTNLWMLIGINRPDNHDEILKFICEDVKETADPNDYNSGDMTIAFRRFLEKDFES